MIKRTTGISTTDLTGRLLELLEPDDEEEVKLQLENREPPHHGFLQTSTRIALFSNRREPTANEKIVYFSASCDLMHPGVIERMKLAKQQGDFLYVGLWDDESIKYYKGRKYPLVGLQERTLASLAIQWVDDVIIGAPYVISKDLLTSLNVNKVVHVQTNED